MGELEQLRSRVAALEAELATARGQAGARPASGESAPPRSVEQVHEVFAQAPLVLFALDRAGTFTLHEGKGSSSSRVKPGELLGTSIYQNWGHVPGVVEAFERALGGSVARWEGGNGVAQYESIYAPQRDGTGQVIGVSGISIDVTARKRAEDAVRRSESRFRGMIEKSQEIIFLVDRDGTRLYGSAATERILGVKAESMVGRPFGEGMHPEDKLAAVAAREALLAEPGGTRVVSFRVPHPDGRQLWIEATMTNLLHDPDVGAMVVNARDVTEHRQAEDALRRSERRFRGMIEKSQEVIFLSDHEGTIVYGSPSTGPILGHPSEETLGKKFGEFTHVDDRAGLRAARAALLAEPGGSRVVTFRASRRDGTSLPVEATMTNLLHDPDVGAMVLNARDITERRRAEDVLRERQHALEQAQEVAHVGSWSTGRTPDDPILWTPECARIFRRPHDQPPTVRAFLEMVYPEDQPRFMAAR
jgi:PAS domain S-box-containing protein